MQLYWPEPTPPGRPNRCLACECTIDGIEITGYWLEREHWQNPNTHELYCLSCCTEKMNEWPNLPDVTSEAEVRAYFDQENAV